MRFLRSPLLQFVVLGSILFIGQEYLRSRQARQDDYRIELGAIEIQFLADSWSRRWQRPPTREELEGVIRARVREEVLYREALSVGLDTNDAIVRQRMVQKMEMLSEDLATLNPPTDAELRAFWKERSEDYVLPVELSFSHVYFNPEQRGDATTADAEALLAELRAADPPPIWAAERGDRFLLGHSYELATRAEVAREYGTEFAAAVFEMERGWHGPIASGFGLHLVYVAHRIEAREPEFEAIRNRLALDFDRTRRDEARDRLYEAFLERYEVEVEEAAIDSFSITVSGGSDGG